MNSARYVESLTIAIRSLDSNRARSALTMLGVIIGVFSVTALVALGQGIQNYIEDQFNALGSNLVFVSPGKVSLENDPALNYSTNKLGDKHLDLINDYAGDYVVAVTPSVRVGKTVEYKNKDYYSTIVGANEEANDILNLPIDTGRFFGKSDVRSESEVALIGSELKKEFFPNSDPVGEAIVVDGESYEIIGVLKPKNQQFDETVIIPYTTVMKNLDVENFSSIGVKLKDQDNMRKSMLNIELALLRDLKEEDFTVLSQEEILGSIQSILQVLTIGLGAIAGISLLVGGIGIMNIMLVSVTERTREIGLRKAVGANETDIASQFIFESVLLSVTGGVIGIILGFLASLAAQTFVRAEVPFYAVVLAFGFSVLVGVIFGTYPAVQASKKDPIEALRYE